jgi:predicted MPP superfamily phosphohydrolase
MISNDTNTKQPDFIGDIHSHNNALELLLKKMGYEKKNGVYNHPVRFPVFLGDYIDRGSNIKDVLHLVRSMQKNGSVIALMGNHEYNYLCYHIRDENEQPFRQNDAGVQQQI